VGSRVCPITDGAPGFVLSGRAIHWLNGYFNSLPVCPFTKSERRKDRVPGVMMSEGTAGNWIVKRPNIREGESHGKPCSRTRDKGKCRCVLLETRRSLAARTGSRARGGGAAASGMTGLWEQGPKLAGVFSDKVALLMKSIHVWERKI
jgi:hypothetical protein